MKGGEVVNWLCWSLKQLYYYIGGNKMKKKKVFALTLVLTLIVGIFALVPSVGAVSDSPVKLIYAKPAYTSTGTGATGYVEVENLAYDKNITIHYSFDGNEWFDTAAEYYRPTYGNYEAWTFETTGKYPTYRGSVTVQFAIKYEVNGQTYWDNNNGNNYTVSAGYLAGQSYDFGVGGIANVSASKQSNNNTVYGSLQLKNLGYQKDVKVIYTTDNWATTNEVSAEYDRFTSANDSVEIWDYSFETTQSDIQYKLSYTVNGTTYIDDNFGDYYTVTVY